MTVPRSRLLFWVGMIVVPLFGWIGATPAAFLPATLLLAGFLAVVAMDAWLSRRFLSSLSVEVPPLVRLAAEREGSIELRIRDRKGEGRRIRLGLALPEAVGSLKEDLTVLLPREPALSRVEWPCRPLARGRYQLERAALETPSALGLWDIRRSFPALAELRVYPNLLKERRDVAAIFLKRGLPGVHAQRQVGKGREFEKLREYIAGDPSEDIHWKATAKRGHPTTKVFQIERTQEVYVVLDISRLSARSTAASRWREAPDFSHPKMEAPGSDADRTPALDRAVVAALVLAIAAERQGDLFGLVTFSDRVSNFVRARNGRAHFNNCRDALYAVAPQTVSPDFDELFAFLRLRLRRRALLVFLTDLDDPLISESFLRNVELVRRQHVVIVAMRQPPDAAPLFSNPDVLDLDDLYRKLAGHLSWQSLRELEGVLRRQGVELALLPSEHMSAGVVSRYLRVKQRQLL